MMFDRRHSLREVATETPTGYVGGFKHEPSYHPSLAFSIMHEKERLGP